MINFAWTLDELKFMVMEAIAILRFRLMVELEEL